MQDVLVQVIEELASRGILQDTGETEEKNSSARYTTVLLQPSQTSSANSISLSTFPSTLQISSFSSNVLNTNIAVNRDLGKKCWCNAGSVYDGTKCVENSRAEVKHQTCETYFTNGFYPLKQNMVLFFLQFGKSSKISESPDLTRLT